MDVESDARPGAGRGRRRGWPLVWAGLYPVVVVALLFATPELGGGPQALGSLLAASLLLGLARRAPVWAFGLALLGSTAVATLSRDHGSGRFWAFLVADLAVGRLVARRPRRTWITAVAVTAALEAATLAGMSEGAADQPGTLALALLALVTCCVVGRLGWERRQYAAALRAQAVTEAVTAERLRIARELHDMVAHSIGVITIQAGVGSRVVDRHPQEARAALRAIEETSREALSGLRRTLVALRRAEPGADPGGARPPAPGLADLDRLTARAAAGGVRVELRTVGEPRPLPPDLDLSAYRIVQEAVTNVLRHAHTAHCTVTVTHTQDALGLEITDAGRGVPQDAMSGGFGLAGMRERAALLNGTFTAGPGPEGGFRVAARLPLPTATAPPEDTRRRGHT